MIGKESTDQKFMLSFVLLFSFLTNQKLMLSSSQEKNIYEDLYVGFEAQAKEGRPRGQGRPGELPTLEKA